MVNNDIVGREVINMIKLYIYSLKCMTFIKLNTAAAFIYFFVGPSLPLSGNRGGGPRPGGLGELLPQPIFWGRGLFSSREVSQ